MYLIIFAFFVLGVILNYLYFSMLIWKAKITPSFTLPFIGHTFQLYGDTESFYRRLQNYLKSGKNISVFLGIKLIIFLCNTNDVLYLTNKENYIQEKTAQYDFFKAMARGRKTIFEKTGNEYKQTKKICLEAVSPANLKGYMESFNKCAKTLIVEVESYVNAEELDISPNIKFCIISLLLETVLGIEDTIMSKKEILEYEFHFSRALGCASQKIYNPFLKSDFIFKNSKIGKMCKISSDYLHEETEKLVKLRKEKFEKSNPKNKQFRSVFVDKYFRMRKENGQEFTMEDIRIDVMFIFGAGFHTSVITIGFVLLLLAMNEDVQHKVVKEIKEKLNGKHEFSIEDLNEMTYLEMVICEVMRLYPPVSYIGRKMTDDLEMPNGGVFQKGTDFYIAINKLHRDPNFYQNPATFNPENFLPENTKKRLPSSYMPFGFGMRKCFGKTYAILTLKCVLCHFLQEYEVKTTKTEKDFILAFELTLMNKIGCPISIFSRK